MANYLKQNLIAVDQLANTILGGYADETLSSRAYRTEAKGRIMGRILRPVIDALFFFDKDHCYNSYLSELNRSQFPSELK
jgi:hypothetical protein